MNAAGLVFVLGGISPVLGMPMFQPLVTDGSISQNEFDGTRENVAAVLATLKKTPLDKIEAMVSQYNDVLTEQLGTFQAKWTMDYLTAFRAAQIMVGFVSTIMAKSGLST